MRIASLHPALTDMVYYFGMEESLVGVSFRCDHPKIPAQIPRLTEFRGRPYASAVETVVAENLTSDYLRLSRLKEVAPDVILTISSIPDDDPELLGHVCECLNEVLGYPVRLLCYNITNLTRVFEMFESLGRHLKVADKGHNLSQKMKAQFMVWGDSLYERTKNKKVTFLSGVSPLVVAGGWIADIIRYASALPQVVRGSVHNVEVAWEDIRAFRPDVLIVAPVGYSIADSKRSFMELEKLPGWDDIPAVKRGEVFFSDGDVHFHRPTAALVESGGIIFSAVAGHDSGYICERDSMFRLRYLEMNRHRL